MNRICVLGSINIDVVLNMDNMPRVGETIIAHQMKKVPGGKGANQAVAARRLEAEVTMIGRVGKDEDGRRMVEGFERDGIVTKYIFEEVTNPTGTAIINVDKNGNNSIIVVSGANMTLTKKDIHEVREVIESSDVLIAQFETPIDVTCEAFKIARNSEVTTILNPAPAKNIPEELLNFTDIIIPNETECETITGQKVVDLATAINASKSFIEKGVKFTIITLGEKGAALISKDRAEIIPAFKVKAIDTTAAGDSFIGAISSRLTKDRTLSFDILKDGILFASKVSSIVVQREGAQTSLPYLKDLKY
jgi:ribokinase